VGFFGYPVFEGEGGVGGRRGRGRTGTLEWEGGWTEGTRCEGRTRCLAETREDGDRTDRKGKSLSGLVGLVQGGLTIEKAQPGKGSPVPFIPSLP